MLRQRGDRGAAAAGLSARCSCCTPFVGAASLLQSQPCRARCWHLQDKFNDAQRLATPN